MAEKKAIPAHILEQRASKDKNQRLGNGELHSVFLRVNMHDGDKELCWEWRGAHGKGTRDEYRPRVTIGDKDYYAYRIVYQLYYGLELQPDDVVRHKCDNSWCCNPYHMLIGKQRDNVQDMLERERVGMKHYQVKRIMQMLEIGASAEFVCEKMKQGYGVSLDVSMIRKIRLRKVYKNIVWEWGDKYAAERRARLASIREGRLASVSQHGIIDHSQHNTEKEDGEG